MPFAPGYGETPVPDDELGALLPAVREVLGEPLTKATVYDLEQAVQEEVAEVLLTSVLDGSLGLDDLLTDRFVRELHRRLYGDIWTWAGVFRKEELNIGVAPEMIAVELLGAIETMSYRWHHTEDWTPRVLGIAAHAETVRIHPFTDGNGRTTRLMADLVFAAAQDSEVPELYDWQVDKRRYIDLLRRYDGHRDPTELAIFIGTTPLGY
ncbi:Fic family protein [Glaciibacter superstes]|uniref:Fic family protein n=1 Tax=Glaciibacter superstes TaxID=501023 RepID=UPI0003B5F6BB|nr:Fic family protein [Glaciibacter superstes]